jgi:hypothetical protein
LELKLFIATPCYRSDPKKAQAWAERLAGELGIAAVVCAPASPPWLHVARALIAGTFREHTDCTHILWRDDDIDVSPATVARMIAADVPAIVAPYVLRSEDEARPSTRFDTTLYPETGTVQWAGLGCALLRRAILSRLWFDYESELHFERHGRRYVAIFRDLFAERDDGTELLHEDQAFWWRVQTAGYLVQALDDVMVPHAGEALRWRSAEHWVGPV